MSGVDAVLYGVIVSTYTVAFMYDIYGAGMKIVIIIQVRCRVC